MRLKSTSTLIALVALIGLSALAYWWQNRGPGTDMNPAKAADTSTGPRPGGKPGAGPGAGGPSAPVAVEVGRVSVQTLTEDAQAVGALRARQAVVLKPEVSGRVVKLGFVDGKPVRRGQVLIQLDDALQAAQLQQAEAQASIARSNLQRNRELLSQGFVSASVVDQSAATLQVAEAQVALNKAQLSRMQILAPFDGVAGIRSVSLGDYVKDGTELVALEDASSMWVDFRLPERYVPLLKLGQAVELNIDALPGRQFSAQVEAMDAQLEANGRSLLVRAKVQSPTSELRSGLFARVRVVFATRENALVVPEEALVPVGGKQFIIKVVEGEAGKPPTAQRLEARLGARLPGKVELLSAADAPQNKRLMPGDRVVTAGQARLLRGEGQPLKVVDVDKAMGSAAPRKAGASGPSAASAPASR